MKPKSLAVLAGVVLALGAFIWFFERHQPSTDEARRTADRLFPDLEADQVTGVVVESAEGTVVIRRSDDGEWRLEQPLVWPADSAAVDGAISAILNLDSERRLAPGEVELAAHGLDQPDLTVRLDLTGRDPVTLSVGDETALGSDRAVTLGDGGIAFTSTQWVSRVKRAPESWRSREVTDLSLAELATISMRDREDDRVEAVRLGESWRLRAPVEDLADEDQLRRVVGDFNAARIEEFVDAPSADLLTSLDPPAYRVQFLPADGSAATTLELGPPEEHPDGARRLCRRNDAAVFWIADTATTALAKAPVLWREAGLYPFSSWDARAVTIETGDQTVELTSEDGVWQVNGGPADGVAVREYLMDLADLEVAAFGLQDLGEEVRGTVELVLETADEGDRTVTYTLFEPLLDGGRASVTVSDRPTRMAITTDQAARVLADSSVFAPAEDGGGDEPQSPATDSIGD